MTESSVDPLTHTEREGWSAALLRRMLEPSPFPPTEYLPVPWYGRLRQLLAAPIYWLSYRGSDFAGAVQSVADGVFGIARAIHYHPKPKKRADLGLTINFRKYGSLTMASTQTEPDALDS